MTHQSGILPPLAGEGGGSRKGAILSICAKVYKALFLLLLLSACAPERLPPLSHEAYLWQRQWTPALNASIAAAQDHFVTWRVLAMETTRSGDLVEAAPQLDVLARSARPVVAVARLNGNQPPPNSDLLTAHLREAIAKWRSAGIDLIGVEIDHDCATSQLDRYADLLAKLRADLPADLKLSITALPTWIGVVALPRVLAQADSSVLQVHAILAPSEQSDSSLFDAQRAQHWIDEYAKRAPHPFLVALPAYGLRVGFDESGRANAVESEMPRDIDADNARELRVDPADVAGLLRALERSRPSNLLGVVWFRLPSVADRRAWSLSTLLAVIGNRSLHAQIETRIDTAPSGASDIVLINRGMVDATLPARIEVRASGCSAGDAVDGFRVDQQTDGWHFLRQNASDQTELRAGRERRIGWLRCASVEGATIHE